ncbi:MAG TPA: L,D-transpeptidase [Candidatus Saccharimonadia bacterium]|nr:L,D-transpeptidase [Candidatus Saccharimonadia bacterium]
MKLQSSSRNTLVRCALASALLGAGAAHAATDWSQANDPAAATQGKLAQLRAQVLLERAHFSPGQIDGEAGSNVKRALTAYQTRHGLPVTGKLDAATWEKLNADTAPVLAEYTLVEADVAGPFVEIPKDMMEKAALEQMGYETVLEALGEKFHSSPALLKALNPGKDFSLAGETLLVPQVEAEPLAPAARVVVDKSDSTVSLQDDAGTTYAMFPATTGSEHDPLPLGEWKIQGVANAPVFNYNPELFWDADPTHAKATIKAGPNNPVGVAWVDLSKEHYGIHGTPEPRTIAKTQSHGCIRLTNWSVAALAKAVKPGTPALLQE